MIPKISGSKNQEKRATEREDRGIPDHSNNILGKLKHDASLVLHNNEHLHENGNPDMGPWHVQTRRNVTYAGAKDRKQHLD